MKRVRTLIVDDSATRRAVIERVLSYDPEIEIVGSAANAFEALSVIKTSEPDVLTLDIEMPRLSGLDFLRTMMRIRPMPVVMVSVQTTAGARATNEVLALGAYDWAAAAQSLETLADKVKAAARTHIKTPRAGFFWNGRIAVIGASAGGVEGLLQIVARFPEGCPPTLIVQHIPASFVPGLVQRMNRYSSARVSVAADGMPLEPGHVYVAPGANHLELAGTPGHWRCRVRVGEPVQGFIPSIDVLFQSAARAAGASVVGAVLSGLGRDGVSGMVDLYESGALTLAQHPASCTAYALPKAAIEAGAVDKQLSCEAIATEILEYCDAGKLERYHV